MMKPRIKHALSKACLISVSSLVLTGCFDLGCTDTTTYYNSFNDDIKLLSTDETNLQASHTESYKDRFFNDDTVNNIGTANVVEARYYEYLMIKVESDGFPVENVALYFRGDGNESTPKSPVTLRYFISKDGIIPLHPWGYWSPITPIFPTDDEEPEGEEEEIDDNLKNCVCEINAIVNPTKWTDSVVEEWNVDGKYAGFINIPKGEYVIVQFVNNTGYGRLLGLKPVKFTLTNFMLSKYDPEGLSETTPTDTPDDDVNDEDYDDSHGDDYDYD